MRKTSFSLSKCSVHGGVRYCVTAPRADGPGRQRRFFADKAEAKTFLELKRAEIARHGLRALSLGDQDRANFLWCAEHPSMRMPAPVACRSQGSFGPELRHAILHRKEFQWHMPAGARIRFQDCSELEIPTADFNCAPQAATRR